MIVTCVVAVAVCVMMAVFVDAGMTVVTTLLVSGLADVEIHDTCLCS